ncbi:MAG: hypothetical protein HKN60_10275, partial [Rhizobiales bacterium]|nr:hypothetical protein [Hyphomicrobiales bacterium]
MAHEDATNLGGNRAVEAHPRPKSPTSARERPGPSEPTKAEQLINFPGDPSRAASAAASNDDEPFAAALIEGLRRTPTNGPMYFAAIFSGLWIFAGVLIIANVLGDRIASSGSFV